MTPSSPRTAGIPLEVPARRLVRAVRHVGAQHRLPRGVRPPGPLLPAEPPQVPLQTPGRDSPEPPEEPSQPLVQHVDHAELVLARVGRAVAVARRRARLGERGGVRGVHVGGRLRPRDARGRQPRADLVGAGAAARGQDRGAVAQVVDDGYDGDLQLPPGRA